MKVIYTIKVTTVSTNCHCELRPIYGETKQKLLNFSCSPTSNLTNYYKRKKLVPSKKGMARELHGVVQSQEGRAVSLTVSRKGNITFHRISNDTNFVNRYLSDNFYDMVYEKKKIALISIPNLPVFRDN